MKWGFQVFILELRKLITYRADFWVSFFGLTFFSLTIAYFLWESIFYYTGNEIMSGFTMDQMIFYYIVTPLIFRIQQGQGIGFLSREIYDGGLNKYLLYPLEVHHFKLATYLAHACFYLLQLILMILLYLSFMPNPVFDFNIFSFLGFLIVLVIVSIAFYYIHSIVEQLAFWFDNIWSLGVMLRYGTAFLGGALIPLSFFPEWAQVSLSYTPFPYLIHFPYQTLMNEITLTIFVKNILITIVWLFIFKFSSHYVWVKGRYKYTGVGI